MNKKVLLFCCSLFMSGLLCAEEVATHIPIARVDNAPFSMRIGMLNFATASTGGIPIKELFSPSMDKFMGYAKKNGKLNVQALIGTEPYVQFTIKDAHTVKLNATVDVGVHARIAKEVITLADSAMKGDIAAVGEALGLGNLISFGNVSDFGVLPDMNMAANSAFYSDTLHIDISDIDPATLEELKKKAGDLDPATLEELKKQAGNLDPSTIEKLQKKAGLSSSDLGGAFAAPVVERLNKILDPNKTFLRANAFADIGAMYQFSADRYRVSARISPFLPLIYTSMPNTSRVKLSGTTAYVDYYWYTAFKKGYSPDFSKLGLDFSLAGAYTLTDWADVDVAVKNIPILASSLNKGYKAKVAFNLMTRQMEQLAFAETSLPLKKVRRTCKIRLGADFRPLFNDYLIASPFIAFPIAQQGTYYVDSGLKIESHFARILGAYYRMAAIDRNWQQEACFFVDSRWVTLSLGATLISDTFAHMFSTSSLGVKFGVGFGF